MRVELIYTPGCNTYKNVRNTLEMVIAEERLPIPVELVEAGEFEAPPYIRIDGLLQDSPKAHAHSHENIRAMLCRKWKELTECAMAT